MDHKLCKISIQDPPKSIGISNWHHNYRRPELAYIALVCFVVLQLTSPCKSLTLSSLVALNEKSAVPVTEASGLHATHNDIRNLSSILKAAAQRSNNDQFEGSGNGPLQSERGHHKTKFDDTEDGPDEDDEDYDYKDENDFEVNRKSHSESKSKPTSASSHNDRGNKVKELPSTTEPSTQVPVKNNANHQANNFLDSSTLAQVTKLPTSHTQKVTHVMTTSSPKLMTAPGRSANLPIANTMTPTTELHEYPFKTSRLPHIMPSSNSNPNRHNVSKAGKTDYDYEEDQDDEDSDDVSSNFEDNESTDEDAPAHKQVNSTTHLFPFNATIDKATRPITSVRPQTLVTSSTTTIRPQRVNLDMSTEAQIPTSARPPSGKFAEDDDDEDDDNDEADDDEDEDEGSDTDIEANDDEPQNPGSSGTNPFRINSSITTPRPPLVTNSIPGSSTSDFPLIRQSKPVSTVTVASTNIDPSISSTPLIIRFPTTLQPDLSTFSATAIKSSMTTTPTPSTLISTKPPSSTGPSTQSSHIAYNSTVATWINKQIAITVPPFNELNTIHPTTRSPVSTSINRKTEEVIYPSPEVPINTAHPFFTSSVEYNPYFGQTTIRPSVINYHSITAPPKILQSSPTIAKTTPIYIYGKNEDDDGGLTKQFIDKAVEMYHTANKAVNSAIDSVSSLDLTNSTTYDPIITKPFLFMLILGGAIIIFVLSMMLVVYLVSNQVSTGHDDDSIY